MLFDINKLNYTLNRNKASLYPTEQTVNTVRNALANVGIESIRSRLNRHGLTMSVILTEHGYVSSNRS